MANETITPKWMTGSYQYIMYLGENIEDPDSDYTKLTLNSTAKAKVKIDETEYSIELKGVKFNRKIYEPGLIEAEVGVTPVAELDVIEEIFKMRKAELALQNNANTATDDNKLTTIAKNYYVSLVNPQIVTASSGDLAMYVKLTVNSMDHLMTLDKYSMTYTAKKLGSEILDVEGKNFGFKKLLLSTNSENLRNLKYMQTTVTKDKTETQGMEFIQPYLVQYNETFHNFMVRTANRCGEFFYFEDGQLFLGLPETDEPEQIDSFSSVTFQNYTCGPVEVETFGRDSVKDDDTIGEYNYDVIEKDNAGYPEEIFPGKLQYNSPLAHDEYIFPLEKGKWSDVSRELFLHEDELKFTLPFRAAFEVVECDDGNIPNLIASAGASMTTDWLSAKLISDSSNESCDKTNFDKYDKKKEQSNGTRVVQFSSLSKEGWTTLEFYQNIREHEVEQQKKVICIDMGTNYVPVKLGEAIKVKGLKDTYIVIQVNQISNLVWTRNYKRFDNDDSATDLYSKKQSQVIYAIPTYQEDNEEKAIPPLGPLSPVRKSGPQTAFIVDNDDPKHQGRVRISYPWQAGSYQKRLAMHQAEASLAEAEQAEAKALENVAALKELLRSLREDGELLESMKGKSGKEVKALITEKKAQLEKLKKELEELKKKLEELEELEETGKLSASKLLEKNTTKEDIEKKQAKIERLEKDITLLEELDKRIDNGEKAAAEAMIKKNAETIAEEQQKKNDTDKDLETAQAEVPKQKENLESKTKECHEEAQKSASPWIRISTPMATEGGGVYFKPNKGDEVLINYDNDNVERPYVVGSVYSKNVLTPGDELDRTDYSFMQKRASIALMSPNGQHITFNAPNDALKFVSSFSPAWKCLQPYFPALKPKWFNGDEKDLAGGIFMGDRYGMYELSMSSHDRKIKIESSFGNVEISAFSGIKINAPNGDIKIIGKNISLEAGNKLTLKSGTNVEDDGDESLLNNILGSSVSGTFIDMGKTFLTNVKDSTIGNALSLKIIDFALLRCVIEVFMRPIDGTLLLKSNNYVMLEAGKGKANVPLEYHSKTYQDFYKMEDDSDKKKVFGKTNAYVNLIDKKINQFVEDYKTLKEEAYSKKAAYEKAINSFWDEGKGEKPEVLKAAYKLNEPFKKTDDTHANGSMAEMMTKFVVGKFIDKPANGWKVPNHDPINTEAEMKTYIKQYLEDFAEAVVQLHDKTKQIKTFFEESAVKAVNSKVTGDIKDQDTEWIDKIMKDVLYKDPVNVLGKVLDSWNTRYGSDNPTINFLSDDDKKGKDDPLLHMTTAKRKAIAILLSEIAHHAKNNSTEPPAAAVYNKYFTTEYETNQVNDDYVTKNWHVVAAVGDSYDGKFKRGLKAAFAVYDKLFDVTKAIAPVFDTSKPMRGWAWKVWDNKSGQIIFSTKKGATYALNGENIEKFDFSSETCNKATLKKSLSGIK